MIPENEKPKSTFSDSGLSKTTSSTQISQRTR